MPKLIIVESPGKIKKIQSYLGSNYIVKASFGHIRDLVKDDLSVDIENSFTPLYKTLPDKIKVVKELRDIKSKCEEVIIASDEDREGEFIADSIAFELGLDSNSVKRIVFHEITKDAIGKAVQNPGTINKKLVLAQQARRVLDRLVGFKLSPLMWKLMNERSSAGRVQSVVVKLVVEREKEIISFNSNKFYAITGTFYLDEEGNLLKTRLMKSNENVKDRVKLKGEQYKNDLKEQVLQLIEKFKKSRYIVNHIEEKILTRSPQAPFTTSTLQQECSTKLKLPIKTTMDVAQKLYEKGYITYMRTDSVNLSEQCLDQAKTYILDTFGEEYYTGKRQYTSKQKNAQEAHEAIRPTDICNKPSDLEGLEQKIYEIIWKRTVSSQMANAKIKCQIIQLVIKFSKANLNEFFEGDLKKIIFDGFLALYDYKDDDDSEELDEEIQLPNLGNDLALDRIIAEEKLTQPVTRYNEATLVKKLEDLSIGRPSTYANIINKIQDMKYVEKKNIEGKKEKINIITLLNSEKGIKMTEKDKEVTMGSEKNKLVPTHSGIKITEILNTNFSIIMDYKFTAKMEDQLDDIVEGKSTYIEILTEFYDIFKPLLEKCSGNIKLQENDMGKLLGVHPIKNLPIYATNAKYGPVIKMIEFNTTKTGKPNKVPKDIKYAPIKEPLTIDTITLEEAIELFKYPYVIGKLDGKDIEVMKGQYGLYLKYDNKNYQIKDSNELTLDNAIDTINEKNKNNIKTFTKGKKRYEIKDGQYGKYIACSTIGAKTGMTFVKLPERFQNELEITITLDEIETIIDEDKKKKINLPTKTTTKATTKSTTKSTVKASKGKIE